MTTDAPLVLDQEIDGPTAWTAVTLATEAWRIAIPEDCATELAAVVEALRANPLPVLALTPEDFDLAACHSFARDLRARLEDGPGFAVFGNLPVATIDEAEAKALYWLFSNMVSRVVAGAFDGRMLHDVVDTRQRMGLRVRGDLTNQEIAWHTDNGFSCTPDFFGLMCLRGAKEGGVNRAVSLHAAHNEMRRRHPDLLARLYRPFCWNRMGEHLPDDPPVNRFPYFAFDGKRLKGRFNRRIVYEGYALAEEAFDDEGEAALEAFVAILNDPALSVAFALEPGEIVYMNNRLIAHTRTPFVDHEDAARRRHLVRIYMRDHGPRFYLGDEATPRAGASPSL